MLTRMPRRAGLLAGLLCLLLPLGARSAEIVLYDSTQGNLPQNQAWMTYLANPLVTPAPSQTAVGDGLRLDTTNNSNHSAGYFNYFLLAFLKNPDFPALNPAEGFTLAFDLLIHEEVHLSNNRAGFSVILLGQNLSGIELGFWEDSVWAQSGPGFTKAESTGYDTTLELITYELTILNTEYMLLADGSEILSGATRDYSPANPTPDPYDKPNMLFLGDDTGSASADFTLGSIKLVTGPFVDDPLPATGWLLLAGLGWFARRRPR